MDTNLPYPDPNRDTPMEVPKTPWYRRRLTQIAAVATAVLAYPIVKIVIAVLAANVLGGAVAGAFGTQWERLPSDVRSTLEQRLTSVYGKTLDNLSQDQVQARIETDLIPGLLRLDDQTLVHRMTVQAAALNRTTVPTCAAFGRAAIGGSAPTDATTRAMIASLDERAYQTWVEINVSAIEAQHRGTPDQQRVAQTDSDAAFNAVVGRLSTTQVSTIADAATGTVVTDAALCDAVRGLYTAAFTMDAPSQATIARIDVTR